MIANTMHEPSDSQSMKNLVAEMSSSPASQIWREQNNIPKSYVRVFLNELNAIETEKKKNAYR